VCLITVTLILFSISVLGLHFYFLKVHQNFTAAAGTQSLNESWQVFSCFSQLTNYSHTAIKWIKRELCHIMSMVVEDWASFLFIFAQSCHACSWLYCLLYRHFWSVWPSIPALGVIGTDFDCSSFLSMHFNGYNCRCWQQCYNRGHDVSVYIYLPNVGLKHLFSPTQCAASIAVL